MRHGLKRRLLVAGVSLLSLLLLGLAPTAGAGEHGGVGPLDDVDLDTRMVVIGSATLTVSARSEIRDNDGNPMTLRQVDDLDLWWARYSASPNGTIEKMVVFDPDED